MPATAPSRRRGIRPALDLGGDLRCRAQGGSGSGARGADRGRRRASLADGNAMPRPAGCLRPGPAHPWRCARPRMSRPGAARSIAEHSHRGCCARLGFQGDGERR
jgi:hypothetical protein